MEISYEAKPKMEPTSFFLRWMRKIFQFLFETIWFNVVSPWIKILIFAMTMIGSRTALGS